MKPHTVNLEEAILAVFNQACRQDRLDVAEHLLRALETSGASDNDNRSLCLRKPLADAYLTITRLDQSSSVNS